MAIRLVDDLAESDLVVKLGQCYASWAERKGYEVRTIREESRNGEKSGRVGLTREVVLEVTGQAAYGILSAEEGLHEFVFGKTSQRPRRRRFVSVRVLPVPPEFGQTEGKTPVISMRSKAVRAPADRVRTQVTAGAADAVSTKTVIRSYQQTPAFALRDRRAPDIVVKSADFKHGQIDELLFAGIEARKAS